MKKIYIFMLVLLTACDSGGNTPDEKVISFTDVKGTAAIGRVSDGLITAYDFDSCKKGDVLATFNLQRSSIYELTIRLESPDRAILLELSDFIYTEESSQQEVIENNNVLYSSFVLDAGVDRQASISYWTNLAHARTTALCSEGATANQTREHIQQSNKQLSDTLLFDIITVLPDQIGPGLAVFTGLDEMKYAMANAGISYYTHNLDLLNGGTGHHQTYNSSSFSAIAFEDLVADKILDGQGKNGQLRLGNIDLSTDVYRTEISENIYYVLEINDSVLNAQKSQIAQTADALNITTVFDAFPEITPQTPVESIDKRTLPEINKASYFPCDECIAPDQLIIEDCSKCVLRSSSGNFECDMTLQLDIKDPKNRSFTVTGKIDDIELIGGEVLGALTPIVNNAETRLEGNNVTIFNLKYEKGILSGPIAKRNISFTVTNEFGFSQNFTVEADNQVPTGVLNEFTCAIKITSIAGEVINSL